MLSESHQQQIRDSIEQFLKGPAGTDIPAELVQVASALGALPTYADMGGALLVLPDGQVLAVHSNQSWDTTFEYQVENDPGWTRVAYDKGHERYPLARPAFDALLAQLAS